MDFRGKIWYNINMYLILGGKAAVSSQGSVSPRVGKPARSKMAVRLRSHPCAQKSHFAVFVKPY